MCKMMPTGCLIGSSATKMCFTTRLHQSYMTYCKDLVFSLFNKDLSQLLLMVFIISSITDDSIDVVVHQVFFFSQSPTWDKIPIGWNEAGASTSRSISHQTTSRWSVCFSFAVFFLQFQIWISVLTRLCVYLLQIPRTPTSCPISGGLGALSGERAATSTDDWTCVSFQCYPHVSVYVNIFFFFGLNLIIIQIICILKHTNYPSPPHPLNCNLNCPNSSLPSKNWQLLVFKPLLKLSLALDCFN